MNRQFETGLLRALGLGDRKITDLVITCKAGEVTTVHCTELIIGDRSVDEIARTFDLVESNEEVGKSLALSTEK